MKEMESKEKELAHLIEQRDLDQDQNAVSIAHRIKEVRQERDMLRKTLKRKQDNLKSVQKRGGVEKILNLKELLKSPSTLRDEIREDVIT